MKKLLLALVLVSVGGVMARSWQLPSCPNITLPKCGSYLQHCSECVVCDNQLYCHCQGYGHDGTVLLTAILNLPEGWSANTCVNFDQQSHNLSVNQ